MWSFSNDLAQNVLIFGADNSLSPHTNNLTNNFLVLGERPTDSITDSTGAAEKKLLTLVKQRQNFAYIIMVMRVTCM